jgi:ComF family protein
MAVNLNAQAHAPALGTRLGRWLLPPRCLLCAEPGSDGLELCVGCRIDLPWNDAACARCALPLPQSAPACGACLKHPPAFTAVFAPLRYAAPVDRLLTRFKFHAGLADGRLLAELICARADTTWLDGIDAVLPLPLHARRLGRRGYNQALELARPLAKVWNLPLHVDALRRVRDTAPQSELDAETRRRNVRGAFAAEPDRVRDKTWLLIDDVITTGATVREAAATLLAAGAREVRVLAAARVA